MTDIEMQLSSKIISILRAQGPSTPEHVKKLLNSEEGATKALPVKKVGQVLMGLLDHGSVVRRPELFAATPDPRFITAAAPNKGRLVDMCKDYGFAQVFIIARYPDGTFYTGKASDTLEGYPVAEAMEARVCEALHVPPFRARGL